VPESIVKVPVKPFGFEPVEVISDIETDPKTGAAAYKLEKINGEVQEMRLAVGTIS
jgi:hypothetical protein